MTTNGKIQYSPATGPEATGDYLLGDGDEWIAYAPLRPAYCADVASDGTVSNTSGAVGDEAWVPEAKVGIGVYTFLNVGTAVPIANVQATIASANTRVCDASIDIPTQRVTVNVFDTAFAPTDGAFSVLITSKRV